MGYGSYTAADWSKLQSSRNITCTSSASELFKQRQSIDKFNPKFINMRESCDSDDSPESTPVIIGFDVTGSMGYLAEEIASNALNETILHMMDKQPVSNPHVLVAAIGDSKSDAAPLQVTQFEADIRIVEQLLDLYLEGRGGGNGGESYHLAWYFADKHTKTDAYTKRQAKGFLFTVGDEPCHLNLTSDEIARVFGDKAPNMSSTDLYKAVSEKYETFHIIMSGRGRNIAEVQGNWESIIGKRYAILPADRVDCLSEVITTIMQVAQGADLNQVLNQWDSADGTRDVVAAAIATVDFTSKGGKKKHLFF